MKVMQVGIENVLDEKPFRTIMVLTEGSVGKHFHNQVNIQGVENGTAIEIHVVSIDTVYCFKMARDTLCKPGVMCARSSTQPIVRDANTRLDLIKPALEMKARSRLPG